MPDANLEKLDSLIRRLKVLAQEAHGISGGIPAAEKNLYMILRSLEMLEIEICDPLEVLRNSQAQESSEEPQ